MLFIGGNNQLLHYLHVYSDHIQGAITFLRRQTKVNTLTLAIFLVVTASQGKATPSPVTAIMLDQALAPVPGNTVS